MPFAGQHASPDVENAVNQYVRGMNASRYIPETPEMYRKAAEANKVYLFNVGPWKHVRELGSAGAFIIPPCPQDKEYSEPVVISGVVEEPYPINEVECKNLTTEGMTLALQVLGEGPFIPRSSSFRAFGVFISTSPVPSKDEVAKARGELQKKYVELVAAAGDAYASGHLTAQEVIRPEWHRVAARALRKSEAECPWLGNTQVPAARAECPGCGNVFKVGIIKCGGCGFILDKPKYDKAVKEGLFQ